MGISVTRVGEGVVLKETLGALAAGSAFDEPNFTRLDNCDKVDLRLAFTNIEPDIANINPSGSGQSP